MSLAYTGIAPHPPIIIPSVGQTELDKVKKTISAFKQMEGGLYVSQADTIFIISPHSPISNQAFSLNLANKFTSKLSEFNADKKDEIKLDCDVELISKIKELADEENINVNTISQPNLDHGITVPLYYLTKHLPKVKIVPISYSWQNYQEHFKFGDLLRRVILNSNKRIAIIASGDLSHRLTEEAPAGYHPQAKSFDHLLLKLLEENNIEKILKIDPQLVEDAGECGLRSIIILLGALKKINHKFKKLSYEAPFGVGYLCAEFNLR